MSEQILVALFSFIILIILVFTVAYFLFNSFKLEVDKFYDLILIKAGVRLDKIPLLIETIKKHSPDSSDLLSDLASLRSKTWPVKNIKKRVQLELEISDMLKNVWDLYNKNDSIKSDVVFMGLKVEFKNISDEIELLAEKYNAKARHYNKIYNFALFALFLRILKFKKMLIFEFEG